MFIYLHGADNSYETEQLCRLFFPDENITVSESFTECDDDKRAEINVSDSLVTIKAELDGKHYEVSEELEETEEKEKELHIARILYKILIKHTGFTPPWGILTGVRPVKLFRSLCMEKGEEKAVERFKDTLLVTDAKIAIAQRTFRNETPFLQQSEDNSFSLYISIPFCPTRCAYCSFVSQTVEKTAKLLPEYVDLLVKEISYTAKTAKDLGLKLETVYMGGGTPTTLTAQQMERVLCAVNDSFDISSVREFTVEAGRPDTVTKEKLEAIKRAGVGRISINPQTMNDDIRENIGRKHTTKQTVEAFEMARSVGFDDINMDLIAGLPGESEERFADSLSRVIGLAPEAVTVHTLALKRASNLVIGGEAEYSARGAHCAAMLDSSDRLLSAGGYQPYYLYRQTRIVGNLENVGWSKPGYEGLYNIYIMDETHTILAVGAGGVTKLKEPGVNNIKRIFNHKFPYEYNSRFDEIIDRKRGITEFYEKLR